MNARIPVKYKNLEISEEEAIIIGFFTMVSDGEDDWETWYNIHSNDIKYILNVVGTRVTPRSPLFDNLNQIFEIAEIDELNWSFRWKEFDRAKWIPTRGIHKLVRTHKIELTKKRTVALWSYLVGLYRGGTKLVEEGEEQLIHWDESHPPRAMERLIAANFALGCKNMKLPFDN